MKILLFLFLTVISCSNNKEISLVSYELSACDVDADIRFIKPKIISNSIKNDTLFLTVNILANCGGIYDANVNKSSDTLIINLKEGFIEKVKLESGEYEESVAVMGCNCCFNIYFKITGLKLEPKLIKINDRLFK